MSKVTEKVINHQIVNHMESNHLWNCNLHLYRKWLSSTTALAQVHDTIITASEEKEIAASIAIDESAAFDSICHSILLKKMKMYKFHDETIEWIKNYLNSRSQYVVVGGTDSKIMDVQDGIPQGSTLGPTLYNLYINNFPDIINEYEYCQEEEHNQKTFLFGENCMKCGNISLFADDAVYTTMNKHRQQNQDRLTRVLQKMKNYLNSNRMTINPTKTVLFEFMLKQKACKMGGNPPELITSDSKGNIKIVTASKDEKCLGGTLQNNMQWQAMMETGQEPLLTAVRKKLGILKCLGNNIPRAGKLLLASGLILGKLNYLIPLYGGTQEKYLQKLQVILNNTVRFITGAGKRVNTITLMTSVDWLTIKEMIVQHTLTMAWKVVHLKKTFHPASCITVNPDNTLTTKEPRLQNTTLALRWRMCQHWNQMNHELRTMK